MSHLGRKMCMKEIVHFITDGDKSEPFDLSDDESDDNEVSVTEKEAVFEADVDDDGNDDDVDDNTPVAVVLDNTQNISSDDNTNLQHYYRWKKGTPCMVIINLYNRSVTHQTRKEHHYNILENTLLIRF